MKKETFVQGPVLQNFFTVVINSVTSKASAFVKVKKKFWTISETSAWYIMECITALKSFMMQAPGACIIKLLRELLILYLNKLVRLSLSVILPIV